MRIAFLSTILGVLVLSLFVVAPAQAAPEFYTDLSKQAQAAAKKKGAGFGSPRDPRETAALLIRGALSLVGTLFIAYIIYAGVIIVTSGGDTAKIDKAKSTIRTAVIGVLITLSAYTIVGFVSIAIISSNEPDREFGGWADINTAFNPLEWVRGIRGDGNNGLGQRRYNNNDPLNQPAITPFENVSPPWER